MELYDAVSYQHAKDLTLAYSSSFSLSSKLFAPPLRKHIYAIYGIVRIADEIVDTYALADSLDLLNSLENEIYQAIDRAYSTNPIVHAFAKSAIKYSITKDLIHPFFESMRMDVAPQNYTNKSYTLYIHGSAEVVGLMCLKVFCSQDASLYDELAPAAQRLGAAYQKVNFLRDIQADYEILGRSYFPGISYNQFSENEKSKIIADIDDDFDAAKIAIRNLPRSSRIAVAVSYTYYHTLLNRLRKITVDEIKQRRIRISQTYKIWLLIKTVIRNGNI